MAGKYAYQPPKFGRLAAPQAAKAAFLKKEAFGLSLALSASSGVAMSHLVTEVRGWATVQGRTQIMTNTTCNQPAANQTQLTEESLRHFSGDDIRYSHALNRRTIYTPGIKFVAEAGGAYWLIDAIASYYGSPVMEKAIASDYRLESLHFWRLDVTDGSAVLTLRADADCEAVIRQDIEYTDFPLDSIDIWAGFDGVRWMLYLPSEH